MNVVCCYIVIIILDYLLSIRGHVKGKRCLLALAQLGHHIVAVKIHYM